MTDQQILEALEATLTNLKNKENKYEQWEWTRCGTGFVYSGVFGEFATDELTIYNAYETEKPFREVLKAITGEEFGDQTIELSVLIESYLPTRDDEGDDSYNGRDVAIDLVEKAIEKQKELVKA